MVLLNRIHHSVKILSILILLSNSKHLKMLTHPLYTIELSFVKELFMTQILLDGLAINELPKNKLDKRHFYSALRDIELLS